MWFVPTPPVFPALKSDIAALRLRIFPFTLRRDPPVSFPESKRSLRFCRAIIHPLTTEPWSRELAAV